MKILDSLKQAIHKIFLYSEISKKSDSIQNAMEEIAFFIEYCQLYKSKIENLRLDHEEDEINFQMSLYEQTLRSRAMISIYQHPFMDGESGKELKIQNISKYSLDKLFFDCIEYAFCYSRIFRNSGSREELIRKYIKIFGDPADLSERILKAEIRCDDQLVNALKNKNS